ncbi:HD-GYP domain-containing protein [Fundidesulfovibrio terrae]|uniref:HD-GYP domain-containing protein n=1 Tax=Fundidesulfovibrio terrae TaxID=2922866 RepID=UPI001FAED7A1|nr:HD-GYP domain-containing protein [Fundidesulfovibrio terrae]
MSVRKLVSAERLRPGMYVSRLEMSWFKHPYLSSRVGILKDDKAVAELKALGAHFVEIDLDRGLDEEGPVRVSQEKDVRPENAPLPPLPPRVPAVSDSAGTMRFAKKLFDHGVECTRRVIGVAEAGKPVQLAQARALIARLISSVKANQNVLRLLGVLKDYDEYTFTHCLNVASMGVLFGNHMGLPDRQLELLGLSGLLHDVGKCLLPKEIVNKPGRLTDEEFEVMKHHTVLGWEYIKDQEGIPEQSARGVLEHHERLDGSGYPNQISGSEMDGVSRILSVLDVFDALTSDRVYRVRLSPHTALKTLFEKRGVAFAENVLDRFVKCVGVYPASSVVQLRNGCYAVVTGHDPARPLNPFMTIFRNAEGLPVKPRRVETLRLGAESGTSGYDIVRHVEPSVIAPPDLGTLL